MESTSKSLLWIIQTRLRRRPNVIAADPQALSFGDYENKMLHAWQAMHDTRECELRKETFIEIYARKTQQWEIERHNKETYSHRG